jgi:hypothetical protein
MRSWFGVLGHLNAKLAKHDEDEDSQKVRRTWRRATSYTLLATVADNELPQELPQEWPHIIVDGLEALTL